MDLHEQIRQEYASLAERYAQLGLPVCVYGNAKACKAWAQQVREFSENAKVTFVAQDPYLLVQHGALSSTQAAQLLALPLEIL